MKNLLIIILLAILFSHGSLLANDGAKSTNNQQTTEKSNPVFTITTLNFVRTPPADGCWATFYEDENYQGESLTLWGNHSFVDVDDELGVDWVENFGSIILGTNASLSTYTDEWYEDLDKTYFTSANADTKRGLFQEDVESMTLACNTAE